MTNTPAPLPSRPSSAARWRTWTTAELALVRAAGSLSERFVPASDEARRRRSPAEVTIRPAEMADYAALRSFRCENSGEPWTLAAEMVVRYEAAGWLGRTEVVMLVAECAGEVVGVIAATPQADAGDVYLVQILAVVPEQRRRYIGYELKRQTLATVVACGATLGTSEVDYRNAPMLACNVLFGAVVVSEPDDPETLINIVAIM